MRGDTVLLTRPDPDSRRVARELAQHGVPSVIWPLTRIVPTDVPVAIPPGTAGLIFTSQNAVAAFALANPDRRLRAWCVGDRTAQAAQDAGFGDVISAAGDVAGLARALARHPPAQLLYLRGQHVSADLPGLLAHTGHRVDSDIVYSAQPAGPPPDAIAAQLAGGVIGAVAFWSRRAGAVLADQIGHHPDWPVPSMCAVAISDRAAEPLRYCGFSEVFVAARPDSDSMLAAILAAMRQ